MASYLREFHKGVNTDIVVVDWVKTYEDGDKVDKQSQLSDQKLTGAAKALGKTTWDEDDIILALSLDGTEPL